MAVTQPRGRAAAASNGTQPKRFTLDLPMVGIQVRRPELGLPHVEMPNIEMPHIGRQELGHYVDIARTFLPPPERVAYYGALGVMAVFGVLEWPVAAAIGAGTIIAQRGRRQAQPAPSRPRQTTASAKEPEPSPPATTTRRRTAATSRTTSGRKTTSSRKGTTQSG